MPQRETQRSKRNWIAFISPPSLPYLFPPHVPPCSFPLPLSGAFLCHADAEDDDDDDDDDDADDDDDDDADDDDVDDDDADDDDMVILILRMTIMMMMVMTMAMTITMRTTMTRMRMTMMLTMMVLMVLMMMMMTMIMMMMMFLYEVTNNVPIGPSTPLPVTISSPSTMTSRWPGRPRQKRPPCVSWRRMPEILCLACPSTGS